MAKNKMKYAEKMMSDFRKGMPDGLDNDYFKQVPILFARIQELENALAPFAKTALRERQFKKELVEIYRSDCDHALDMLSPDNAEDFPPPEIWYPA